MDQNYSAKKTNTPANVCLVLSILLFPIVASNTLFWVGSIMLSGNKPTVAQMSLMLLYIVIPWLIIVAIFLGYLTKSPQPEGSKKVYFKGLLYIILISLAFTTVSCIVSLNASENNLLSITQKEVAFITNDWQIDLNGKSYLVTFSQLAKRVNSPEGSMTLTDLSTKKTYKGTYTVTVYPPYREKLTMNTVIASTRIALSIKDKNAPIDWLVGNLLNHTQNSLVISGYTNINQNSIKEQTYTFTRP